MVLLCPCCNVDTILVIIPTLVRLSSLLSFSFSLSLSLAFLTSPLIKSVLGLNFSSFPFHFCFTEPLLGPVMLALSHLVSYYSFLYPSLCSHSIFFSSFLSLSLFLSCSLSPTHSIHCSSDSSRPSAFFT